jgi:hypothetical protein
VKDGGITLYRYYDDKLLRRVRQGGGGRRCYSQDVQGVYVCQILQCRVSTESLGDAQETVQITSRRATRRGAVQGPSTEGGLSHLLPTNVSEYIYVCLTSSRDYIVCTNLRFCDGTLGVCI